jgi:hypothetical protein
VDGVDEKNDNDDDDDDRIDLPTKEEEREVVKARDPRNRTILVVVAMSIDSEDRILVCLGSGDAFLDFPR